MVELMIVIAIAGVLAAIAYPAYQEYVIRSRVTDAVGLLGNYKFEIERYYNIQGRLPTSSAEVHYPTPALGTHINNVDFVYNTNSVVIRMWFAAGGAMGEAGGRNIALLGKEQGNSIKWFCTTNGTSDQQLSMKYMPKSCLSWTEAQAA